MAEDKFKGFDQAQNVYDNLSPEDYEPDEKEDYEDEDERRFIDESEYNRDDDSSIDEASNIWEKNNKL